MQQASQSATRGRWRKTVRLSRNKVLQRLGSIEWPWLVCYEAFCGYGYLYERLSPMAQYVAVAHPGQLRLTFRSKKKHDRVDSAVARSCSFNVCRYYFVRRQDA